MPSDSAQPDSVDLRQYWYRLTARLPLILVITLLGMVGAGAWYYVTPQVYTATATLTVYPLTTERYAANRNIGNLVDMNAEAALASSFRVAQAAAETLPGEWTASELRESGNVSVGKDSSTMSVSVSAEDEAMARGGAQAIADAYLKARSEQAEVSIEMLVGRDQARIDETRKSLAEALERLDRAEAGSAEDASATADVQILNQQVATLLSRISALEGIDTTGGVILNPASETKISVESRLALLVVTGAAVGLIAGVLAAFLLPSRGRKLRNLRAVQRELEQSNVLELDLRTDPRESLAAAAQRIITRMDATGSEVLAVVFCGPQRFAESLSAGLADVLRGTGVKAAVGQAGRAQAHGGAQVVLLPVSLRSAESELLQTLRVADGAVVVLERGVTTAREARAALRLAEEMGCPVLASVLKDGEADIPSVTDRPYVQTRVEGSMAERAFSHSEDF